MTKGEPTNAELLAAAVSVLIAARRFISDTDRTSYRDVCEMLDALHEGFAVAGGSMMHLADRLGLDAEVEGLVKAGQDRVSIARSFEGKGGRA